MKDDTGIFRTDTFELGVVKKGTKKIFFIPIANSTTERIKIVKVTGDCGCITVSNYPSTLYPDKNDVLNVTYDSQFDSQLTGVIYKNVVVQLDQKPFLQSLKLRLTIT